MTEYRIRTYGQVEGEDRSDLAGQIGAQKDRVARRLASVDRLLAVMSGKGGVGKSFLAAALAAALARQGAEVGLVDADLHGPTSARMLGASRGSLEVTGDGVRPVVAGAGVGLMSTDLLLEQDAPLEWREPEEGRFVWRGAQERGMLMEFLSDVVWGERDWLIVDLPPGTDRLEQLVELVPRVHGVLAVTVPSGASRSSVARSLELAVRHGLQVAGVVENMSGYACAECGSRGALFPGRAGSELADRFDIPLLGRIPFDPDAARLAEEGHVEDLLRETAAGERIRRVAGALERAGTNEPGGEG